MTYEQYWYGDPLMVRAFYKAEKIRQERVDAEAWLQGVYILGALNATVGNAFRKGGYPAKYPDEPFSVTKKREKQEKDEAEKEREATWALAWMTNFVNAGKNWGKSKEVS